MQKIILDTDPGIDDAQAIAFAIAHPNIDLLGLTTVFGNASVDITTRNALSILDIYGRPDIPVARGAAEPLQQQRLPAPDFVHGGDGIGNLNIQHSTRPELKLSAAEFIIEQSQKFPGEITLVAVGPLTNIATAIALDPELPSRIKELVVMGGCIHAAGNLTPVAEANFICDPHAADSALGAGWPCTVIGLDVTLQSSLRAQDLLKVRDTGAAMGRFLWDSVQFYFDFYSSQLSNDAEPERACPMHDASALVYLVAADAFEFDSGPARVVPDGIACGQVILGHSGEYYILPHWQGRPDVRAALGVDSESVRQTFMQTVLAHCQA